MTRGTPTNSRRHRVDLGLALLRLLIKPGEKLTTYDIAAWAGCERQNIEQIERKALRAVRVKLQLEELVVGYFENEL
jgi:DNA-directed RNA polymerase sigma subunit (sigma70/sigma32)